MSKPKEPQEKSGFLTLLVFKDGKFPRTFRISTGWVPGIAFLAGIISFLALLGWLAFARSAWHAAHDPWKMKHDALEEQVSLLRSENTDLKQKLPPEPTPETVATPDANLTPIPQLAPGSLPFLFSPKAEALPAGSTVPVRISGCKREWTGIVPVLKLKISCNLDYVGTDGGEQSGHFFVIARGSGSLSVHPTAALSPDSSAASWLPPERGESFKVSRFRLLQAEFGPYPSQNSVQEIGVWIFDFRNRLILRAEVP